MNRGPALYLWDGLLLAEMALVEQGISTGLRGWGSGSQHGIWFSQGSSTRVGYWNMVTGLGGVIEDRLGRL